jgi:hypothetical protein
MSNEKMREALRSIANSTCCGRCQEAALVARAALGAQRQAEPVVSEAMARLTTFLEAQDALDNRELMGPNAEDYFTLIKRRNAARKHLDAAMQKDTQ